MFNRKKYVEKLVMLDLLDEKEEAVKSLLQVPAYLPRADPITKINNRNSKQCFAFKRIVQHCCNPFDKTIY